jgi:hypothetical protein
MRTTAAFTLFTITLAYSVFVVPARAAPRDHVFVASYGFDAPNETCSLTEPCRTFNYALGFVTPGGEVSAIDTAGFGPITITLPVTITSPDGVEAKVVPTPGNDAITINTTGDVFLRGLTIEGKKSANGISISNTATPPKTLGIVHCVIRHFINDGIYLQSTGQVYVSILDTIVANNGNDGIALAPSGAYAYIYGSISRSTTMFNNRMGINVDGSNATGGATTRVTIDNGLSHTDGIAGIYANTTTAGDSVYVLARDTTVSSSSSGFYADGTSVMIFAHSVATGNFDGIFINTNATGYSFGDNHIFQNLSADVNGTMKSTVFH